MRLSYQIRINVSEENKIRRTALKSWLSETGFFQEKTKAFLKSLKDLDLARKTIADVVATNERLYEALKVVKRPTETDLMFIKFLRTL